MPVVWATRVLETLAKTGLPTRAEITDAAMSERAECVMLNNGPHIKEAMRTFEDILHRIQAHREKETTAVAGASCLDVNAQVDQAGTSLVKVATIRGVNKSTAASIF